MSHRRSFIAGNWKMNKTATEARVLVQETIEQLGKFDAADVVICPPYTALAVCQELLHDISEIALGAQNLYEEESGAFTGEISAKMLRDLHCRYVILGHSERRQIFKEKDAQINKKIKLAIANCLRPIVCVGETLAERNKDKTTEVVRDQVTGSLANMNSDEWEQVVVAYEPVWAIGTGKTATPEQAQEVHKYIRDILREMAGESIAERSRILYGGSVKADNAKELISQPDIDGALVGGASLTADSFVAIVKNSCDK